MEIWQTVIITAVGLLVTAVMGLVGTRIAKSLRVLHETPEMVQRILTLNEAQTKNIATLVRVQRPVIRALRSHSYALKECGANGSVSKALEHINEAEDELNGRGTEAIEDSMKIRGA